MIRKYLLLITAILMAASSSMAFDPKAVIADKPAQGDIIMDGNKVTGLGTPTSDSDAATKGFVDDSTGVTVEALTVTEFATSITPQGAQVINLFGSQSTLPADVTFSAIFTEGLDANYAAGTDTATIEAGSPVAIGGLLDLTEGTSGNAVSSVSYESASNFDGTEGAVRVMWRPNFTGVGPGSGIVLFQSGNDRTGACGSSPDVDCRSKMRLSWYNFGLIWQIWDSSGTIRLQVLGGSCPTSVTAGQLYELEVNWEYGPGSFAGYSYLDGTQCSGGTSGNAGQPSNAQLQKFFIGGMNSTAGEDAVGTSNHKVEGLQIFDTMQHTGASYTATGLEGESTNTDLIATIVSSSYEEGDTISIVARSPGRYELTDTASPSADQLDLNADWVPTGSNERLEARFEGTYWQETSRNPPLPADLSEAALETFTAATNTVSSGTNRVQMDSASNAVDAELFDCASGSNGAKVRFIVIDATNATTVSAAGGDSFLGGAPTLSSVGDSATVICDGANDRWEVY